jgi:tetratricopeptide (TPR) repeat protein
MRNLSALLCVPTSVFALAVVTASARAGEIPDQNIQNWNIYNNAGWMLLNRGAYDKAEQRFRMAIAEIRPYAKTDFRLLARSYADLARVLYHQGRYADAEPLARWALSVRESTPKVSPDAVFQSLYTLSLIHVAQEHFNLAEPLLRRALEIQEKEIGPNHIHTAATVHELANVCAEQRKFKEAELLYKRAIAIFQRVTPDENLDLAGCDEGYATMLERLDRKAEATKLREQAKKIRDTFETKVGRTRDTRPRPEFNGIRKSEAPRRSPAAGS